MLDYLNKLISTVLLMLPFCYAHAWGLRIDLDGRKDKVELKKVDSSDNKYIQNITWGNIDERKYQMFGQRKDFPKEKTISIQFSFIPLQSGKVTLHLSGCWVRRPGMVKNDQKWVEYLNIVCAGASISNGDFSQRDAKDLPFYWYLRPGAQSTKGGVKVWNQATASQVLNVISGQVVSLTITAREAETVLALPPEPPLGYKHGDWEIIVDRDSGSWKKLSYKDSVIMSNPSCLPMFGISSRNSSGNRKLISHKWNQQTGVLLLEQTINNWRFEERLTLGKRLKRELNVTNTDKKPATFNCANFFLYLPKMGKYYFPRTFFGDNRSYGDIAASPQHNGNYAGEMITLKTGDYIRGVFDVYFSFFEQNPTRTIMLAYDGQKDASRTSIKVFPDCVQVDIYCSAAGWAEPNIPQYIGPTYIEVFNGNTEATLKKAPHQWFRDIGMVPPPDRPEWIQDVSLWVTSPVPKIGGADGFKGAEKEIIPYVKKRGFNTLWLLPLNDRETYGIRDYYSLISDVGSKDDYRSFLNTAHENGLKVWQDIVPHGSLPQFAKWRGVSPWTLIVEKNGQLRHNEAFDYGSSEWRDYIIKVADYYMENFDIDGFRIDQCGFCWQNWRRPGFPAKAPKGIDPSWWNDAIKKNGGEVPPIETARASSSTREIGSVLTKDIRDVVKKHRPSGAVLAETCTLNCVPAGDVIFDFFYRNVRFKMTLFGGEKTAEMLSRFMAEQYYTDPPGTLREFFLEVHDAQAALVTRWCGEAAGHALRSAMFWMKGVPSMLHGCDVGMGVLLERLNVVRSFLPEFRRGDVDYLAVKSCPKVFAVLRNMPEKSSIGITSFLPDGADIHLTVPVDKLGFAPESSVVLYESINGKRLKEGKLEEFANLKVKLPPFGNAILTWRKAGTALPVPVVPTLTYSEPKIRNNSVKETTDEIIVDSSIPLVIDKKTGLIRKFGDYINGSDIISDKTLSSAPAQLSWKSVDDIIVITSKLTMGAVLQYKLKGNELTIDAKLIDFSLDKRTALILSSTNTRRWQVNSIEGTLDDYIDPLLIDKKLLSFLPPNSQSYRIFMSPILWQSEMKPLNPSSPKIKCFSQSGHGFEIKINDPLSMTFDEVMVLNKMPEKTGFHTAFFWVQPGPLSLAEIGSLREFTLTIRPAREDNEDLTTTKVNGISIEHESLCWRLKNDEYSLRLNRNGGTIKEMLNREKLSFVSDQDICLYGGAPPKFVIGRASLDPDTGVRCYKEDGKLKIRFASVLRNGSNNGVITPPVWAVTEYSLDQSNTINIAWNIYAEGLPLFQNYYATARVVNPQIDYIALIKGVEKKIPVQLKAREFQSYAVNISANGEIKKVNAKKMRVQVLPQSRFWKIYSLDKKEFQPFMIASYLPGNYLMSWYTKVNVRFVPGHKNEIAVQLHVPSWGNIGHVQELTPGKYLLETWIKARGIKREITEFKCIEEQNTLGRFFVELRAEWYDDGKKMRKAERYDISSGSFEWKKFQYEFVIPENIQQPVTLSVAPVIDGLGEGTLWVDIPVLKKISE